MFPWAALGEAKGASADEIISSITDHIQRQGGPRSSWYVGVTSDIDRCLHREHRVPYGHHWFAWHEARSASEARGIRKAFRDWGCDGGSEPADRQSTIVYAYLKTPDTRP